MSPVLLCRGPSAWLPLILSAFLSVHLGCAQRSEQVAKVPLFNQFVTKNLEWHKVQRVLIMPLGNQTQHGGVSEAVQAALATEFQRAGRFEVVMVRPTESAVRASDVFSDGTFDERQLLDLAARHHVQAVLFGMVTQFHPYAPPRLGLSLVLVSPAQAVVIAAVDGMWDAREKATADRAREYYGQTLRFPENLFDENLVLESPDVFRRFVSHSIAQSLSKHVSSGPVGMMASREGAVPVEVSNATTEVIVDPATLVRTPAIPVLSPPNPRFARGIQEVP